MKSRLLNILKNLDLIIASIAFVILVVITFSGVIMRYFFGNPFVWLEELQVALFLWVSFFGGSVAFRVKGHVEINMLYNKYPVLVKKIVSVIIYLVVSFCLFYLMSKSGQMVKMFIDTDKSTSVLSIPSALIYGAIPLCSILMFINYTINAVKEFMALVKEK